MELVIDSRNIRLKSYLRFGIKYRRKVDTLFTQITTTTTIATSNTTNHQFVLAVFSRVMPTRPEALILLPGPRHT